MCVKNHCALLVLLLQQDLPPLGVCNKGKLTLLWGRKSGIEWKHSEKKHFFPLCLSFVREGLMGPTGWAPPEIVHFCVAYVPDSIAGRLPETGCNPSHKARLGFGVNWNETTL